MVKYRSFKSLQLNKRLLIYMVDLILVPCMTVGVASYYIAKQGLDDKGKTILKNSVEMELIIIDSKNKDVSRGILPLEEAQEQVKYICQGRKIRMVPGLLIKR